MLAIFTLSSLALEERFALMACPAHTLRWRSSRHLFPSRTVSHGESISIRIRFVIGGYSCDGGSFALCNLGLGAREARAFLATGVLAIAADPVHAKCSLAPMASAMNPHADLLLHSRHPYCSRHSPLSRLQCQPILSEESTSLLFLESVVLFGRHGAS